MTRTSLTLPPDLAAKLEKVTRFRRGDSSSRKMASVARSILEVGLEKELAMIEGQPIPPGQVFYDAGSTSGNPLGSKVPQAPETPFNQAVAEARAQRAQPSVMPRSLQEQLRDLDMLPRRDRGRGAFDMPFKRKWEAYVEDVGDPEEALDAFLAELDRVERNTGKPVENVRAFFVATHEEA